MTEPHRPIDALQPAPIDDTEDRMGSMEELNFNVDEPTARIGDEMPEAELRQELPLSREREAGLTGAAEEDHQPTDDDMSPETLIHEDGARSPREIGEGGPLDESLTVVDEDDIGGGDGFDEAELALLDPLDGKPDPGI
jgi:hypothetical protein